MLNGPTVEQAQARLLKLVGGDWSELTTILQDVTVVIRRLTEHEETIRSLRARIESLSAAERYWRHDIVTTRLCPVDHRKPHISHDCITEIENRWRGPNAKASMLEQENIERCHDLANVGVAFQRYQAAAEKLKEIELAGANDRAQLLLDAKNRWADRARTAEADLRVAHAALITVKRKQRDAEASLMDERHDHALTIEKLAEARATKDMYKERADQYEAKLAEARADLDNLAECSRNQEAELSERLAEARATKDMYKERADQYEVQLAEAQAATVEEARKALIYMDRHEKAQAEAERRNREWCEAIDRAGVLMSERDDAKSALAAERQKLARVVEAGNRLANAPIVCPEDVEVERGEWFAAAQEQGRTAPRIETAWLIESRFTPGPLWWMGTRHPAPWTRDSLQAVRFARKQDAEAAMAALSDSAMCFVSEHQWGFGDAQEQGSQQPKEENR